MNVVIGETPSSQQSEIYEELKKMMGDVGDRTRRDFQSLALAVVQFRNSRLDHIVHIIDFS